MFALTHLHKALPTAEVTIAEKQSHCFPSLGVTDNILRTHSPPPPPAIDITLWVLPGNECPNTQKKEETEITQFAVPAPSRLQASDPVSD